MLAWESIVRYSRRNLPGSPATAAGRHRFRRAKRCQSSPCSGKLPRMGIDRLPLSVLRTRYVPGGWDVLAFILVFAFLPRTGGPRTHRLADAHRGNTDLARPFLARWLCRAHRAARADRDARFAVHFHVRNTRRQEPPRGIDPGATAGFPAAHARPCGERGDGRQLPDLHQSSVEHAWPPSPRICCFPS
jgi:hypothetical protein